jgi:hypothetical protein
MRVPLILRAAAAAFAVVAMFAGASGARAESVMAACASQWKAAQAAGTTGGATWPQFLARCKTQLSEPSSAGMAPAPAAAPTPPPNGGSLFPWSQPNSSASPAPAGAGQFSTEAEARTRCPSDKVVWVNTASKIYHTQGTRYYARTKQGAYMCEADARAAGDNPARSVFGHKQQ